ncbi:MAG: hypothetical protein JW787_02125 [Sedimentisphaerales bacterium]|nr:hypothetical protein [Sedimentisphaerales bacterium]
MYELLIRIETICMDANLLTLLGVGAGTTIVGLLLWLVGTYFSSAIIGILGAAVGSFCGLMVSQWLNADSLLSMIIGAVVLCIAAVLFRNIIIIVLALIVFALVGGTTYSSIVLGNPPAQQPNAQLDTYPVNSFSHMDSTMRLSYIDKISTEQDSFPEKLKALLKDTMAAMSPHKWKLIISILLGGVGGLLAAWLVKKFVAALCCSIIGSLLVLVGVESLVMAAGFQMCNAFQGHRLILTVIYCAMVIIGAFVQLIIYRSQKTKANKTVEK